MCFQPMKLRLLKSTVFKWGVLIHFGIYLTISQWSILLPYVIVCIAPTSHVAIEIQHGQCCTTAAPGAASWMLLHTSIELPSTDAECGSCVDISFKVGATERNIIPALDASSKFNAQLLPSHSFFSLFGETNFQLDCHLASSAFFNTSHQPQATILRC